MCDLVPEGEHPTVRGADGASAKVQDMGEVVREGGDLSAVTRKLREPSRSTRQVL